MTRAYLWPAQQHVAEIVTLEEPWQHCDSVVNARPLLVGETAVYRGRSAIIRLQNYVGEMKPPSEAAANVSRHGPDDRRQEIAPLLLALFCRR